MYSGWVERFGRSWGRSGFWEGLGFGGGCRADGSDFVFLLGEPR